MSHLALINGSVVTAWDCTAPQEALLIEGGDIAFVGDTAEVLDRCTSMSPVVDLGGRFVLPGLIDAHTHVQFCAISRTWLDVRGMDAEECIDRVRDAVDASPDRWLVAQGTYGQDLPSRTALDTVAPSTPVLVRESMHRLVANSEALKRAGIDRTSRTPIGVVIHRGRDGEPTGLVDEGFHIFPVPEVDGATLGDMLEHELRDSFARHGITTIYELPASAAGVRAYRRLADEARAATRLSLTLTVAPGLNPIADSVRQIGGLGLTRGFGDDMLWLNGVKIFLDGDNGAAFDSAHLDRSPESWGAVTRQFPELVTALVDAADSGLQVWIHAIGDLAQRLALAAIDQAGSMTDAADARTRLEHVANLWVSQPLVDRLRELAVIPVPTAAFMHSDGGVYAYRTLIDNGLEPPGNSDTGGTQPFATNPWFGIAIMMDRRDSAGEQVEPNESVDFATALRVYTEFGARAGFQEHRLGRLEVGRAGDCAVYDGDPRAMTTGQLRILESDLTIVGGRITWDRQVHG